MKFTFALLLFLIASFCFSQNTIPKVLEKLNKRTVPYITVDELKKAQNYILLDTREYKEYTISHLPNAINVGFDKFNSKKFVAIAPDKNTKIVVYCSIGIRSETIGEKLIKMGNWMDSMRFISRTGNWKRDRHTKMGIGMDPLSGITRTGN